MEQKQIAGVLAGVAAFVVASTATRACLSRGISGRSAPSAAVLAGAASELNKRLPMMIDQETEWMSSMGLDGVFVYSYRLVNRSAKDIDPSQLVAALKPQVTNAACSTPETRDTFLKRGVILRYTYSDKDRIHIAGIEVSPGDCGL